MKCFGQLLAYLKLSISALRLFILPLSCSISALDAPDDCPPPWLSSSSTTAPPIIPSSIF